LVMLFLLVTWTRRTR